VKILRNLVALFDGGASKRRRKARKAARKARRAARTAEPTDAALRGLWHKHRPYGQMNCLPAWTTGTQSADEVPLIRRLMTAYRYGAGQQRYDGDSMWGGFFSQHQMEAHAVLMADDVAAAHDLIARPATNRILYGFDNMFVDWVQSLKSTPVHQANYSRIIFDQLLRLAEAIGATRLENPEAGPWLASAQAPVDDVLRAIEAQLGADLVCPDIYADEVGLATCRGVLTYRAVHAMYQAYRMRQLVGGKARPRICEIGGGLGRTALYATGLGLVDYTLVDLPLTGVSQGYYPGRCLGADRVVLPGENTGRNDRIRLLTPADFLALDESFDVVLNVDSMTEFSRDTAAQYVRKISACAGAFLSINHEANSFRIRDLLAEAGFGAAMSRFPYWMRQGYAEEIVTFSRGALP
jgi:hypothetical protein